MSLLLLFVFLVVLGVIFVCSVFFPIRLLLLLCAIWTIVLLIMATTFTTVIIGVAPLIAVLVGHAVGQIRVNTSF